MSSQSDTWPAGLTWVFQGTVAEDATVGTHVVSLTVTPGAGQELEILMWRIVAGATATSQTMAAFIDDGTNVLAEFINVADVASGTARTWPFYTASVASTNQLMIAPPSASVILSGTMRLILRETTAAVSVTQTFAVVARLKTGQLPTATLLDTIGTSVNTTNTNKVF